MSNHGYSIHDTLGTIQDRKPQMCSINSEKNTPCKTKELTDKKQRAQVIKSYMINVNFDTWILFDFSQVME